MALQEALIIFIIAIFVKFLALWAESYFLDTLIDYSDEQLDCALSSIYVIDIVANIAILLSAIFVGAYVIFAIIVVYTIGNLKMRG